jgi:hypothetical protein
MFDVFISDTRDEVLTTPIGKKLRKRAAAQRPKACAALPGAEKEHR